MTGRRQAALARGWGRPMASTDDAVVWGPPYSVATIPQPFPLALASCLPPADPSFQPT